MQQELITLGILFFFALLGSILAARFKQPILLGLLLVGAFIGPKALGLIHNETIMESMIEFGAIIMLFVLGLEFDIAKLQKIGLKAIIIATLNSAILTFIGFSVSVALGFSVTAALFVGVILAFGSTVVIVKVLENKGMMDRQEVPLLIAVLIIEDILAVLIITFFSGVQDKSIGLLGNMETLLISIIGLIGIYMLFIKMVKPSLSWVLKKYDSEEIMTFTALAMCAGFAYLAYSLKLSPAVGAFMAGSIIASLPNAKGFEHAVSPYNLIISSFFFIAIGTMIDFAAIKENIMIILVLVAVVIVTKIIAFSSMVYFFANMRGDRMFFSSIAMFSVGEFSLLVAKESAKFNIGIDLVSISAAIIAVSAIIMSLTIAYSGGIYGYTHTKMPWSIQKKINKFAEYLKAVSEELDLDNKHSKGLKGEIVKTIIAPIVILITIFAWRRIAAYMTNAQAMQEISGINIYYNAGYYLTLAIIAVMMFYMIFCGKRTFRILGDIFANATNMQNMPRSRTIIKKAFRGILLIVTALLMPFFMFLFNIEGIYILVSFAIIAFAVWEFYNISQLMDEHIDTSKDYFPEYRKIDFKDYKNNTKAINQGWKL